MQEFITSLKEAQLESTTPTEITHSLLRFQSEINALFFNGQKVEDVTAAFQEIWKFFLYAASHTNSTVRLAAYRATGTFLLKLSPYYTYIIQNTFSDISMVATIDVKSSAIIASSFAFISSRISLPYLDKFLDKTPVFHHFTISDPIFSEHLSSIISNLGKLGFDWFSTLLHSFLTLSETSKDRYLMKSITSVISHDPIHLMNDFLQYIKDQNSYKKHLSLASYIITSGHIYDDSFDLFNLAKASIDVLNHPKESNPTMIDSAFQILSLKSPSFYLQVDSVGNDTISLTLSRKKPNQSTDLIDFDFTDKNSNEYVSIVIKVSVFKVRPTIYLLELPLMYSEPESEDGSLTLAAKFKSLASRINAYPEKTPTVLSTFIKYYNKKYDSTVSAVIQGIAECFSTLVNNSDLSVLTPLIESVIFTPYTNWFHSADILTVIENMTQDSFETLFGRTGLERIAKLLIDLSISPNDQVSVRSMKILQNLVTKQTFHKLTTLIASHIDIFDDNNLSHLLPLLTDILRDHTKENMSHLHFLVFQLIELQDFYKTNLPVLTSLLHFIGNFTINFVTIKVLRPTFLCAVSIIAASIQCVSGFSEWENVFQFEGLNNMVEIISNDLKSKNIDVSSENSLKYDDYLAPCVAALKFLYGIPVNMVQKDFILILYRKLRNIFPLDSAKFVHKFWRVFNDEERIQAILKMHKSLHFVQNYNVASIITNLFIQINKPEYESKLERCKNALIHTANYALRDKRYLKPEEKIIFKALLFITNQQDKETILKKSANFEKIILDNYPEIYSILFNKPNPNHTNTSNDDQFFDLVQAQKQESILDNPCSKNNQSSSSIILDFSDSNAQISLFKSQSIGQSDIQEALFSSSQSVFQNDLVSNSNSSFGNDLRDYQTDLLSNTPANVKNNSQSNFENDLFSNQPINQQKQTTFEDDLFSNKPTNNNQQPINFENDLFSNQPTNQQKQTTFEDDLFSNKPTNNNQQPINFENDLFSNQPITQQKQTSLEDDLFSNQPITQQKQTTFEDDLFSNKPQNNNQQQTTFEDDLFSNKPKYNNKQQTTLEDDLFSNKPQNNNKQQTTFEDDLFSNQTKNQQQQQPDLLFSNNQDILGITQPSTNTQNDLFSHPQNNSQSPIQTDLFPDAQLQLQAQQSVKSESAILDITQINVNPNPNPNAPQNEVKTYVFEKPLTDLTKPLKPNNPLVKVQIKKKTRTFTSDELYQILLNLTKQDDFSGIKLVLQHCLKNNIQISLKGLNFSEKVVPYAIRYLRLSKSAELESFIKPFLNDETVSNLIYLEVAVSNPTRYLKTITDSEKVKKVQMKNFSSIISPAHFAPTDLIAAVTHCMTKAKSVRKLWYSLVLIQNTLLTLKEIPASFIKDIFSLFESRIKELNYFIACQILNILAAKIPAEPKVMEFAMQFKSLITPSSPELLYVYSIIENLSKGGNALFAKEVPKACDYLLNSHMPSIFITGILLFTFAQKKLTGDRLQSLMRHCFNHITRRLTKTFKYYPIPEISTPALVNILTLPVFKKQQSSLVSSLEGIIPSIDSAAFQTYFLVLIYSLGIVDEKQKFADEQAMVESITKQLISNDRIGNDFFSKLYLKILRARAEKMTPKSKQENYILSNISNFLNNLQENCDFYDIQSFICELLTTLNAFNGFTQLLPVMTSQIFANTPRFFPTFVGVAQFVKKYRIINSGNQDIINKMNSSFVGAGKLMMSIHRSRGFALQLLADPSKMKLALDVASFNDDCQESDLLLQKLNSNVVLK